MKERYYLKADHQTEWDEVSREQFIAAEQSAGFHSKFGPSHPATGGFSGHGMAGRVEYVTIKEQPMSDTLQEREDRLPLVSKNHSERECSEPDCPCHEWVKREAVNCPRCGRTMQSDFDPDVGMWRECAECDYREVVSSTSKHQVTKSGTCAIPGCPCRGWSAQETTGAIVLKEGQRAVFRDRQGHLFTRTVTRVGSNTIDLDGLTYEYNEHAKDVVLVEIISEHQPAARGGGDGWHMKAAGANVYILDQNDEAIANLRSISITERIIHEHNQHQALMAERERLETLLNDIAARAKFALTTPGFIRGRDELQKAVDAIEQRSTPQ